MNKQYSQEFKLEAVKRIEKSQESVTKVARELGVKPTTLHGWIAKYKKSPTCPFPGSGNLAPEDEEVRKLQKKIRDLEEENAILKKAAAYFAKNLK